MTDYVFILGSIGAILTLGAHVPYFIDILRGRTIPHIFSWIVWTLLLSIGIAAQWVEGGGFGTWATIGDAVACFITVLLCLRFKNHDITTSDKVSLGLAFVGIALWLLTDNPLWAVIFAVTADAFGFFPSFRKAYMKPHEETSLTFLMVAIGYVAGFFALGEMTLTTMLYPLYLIVANGAYFIYLLVRRMQLKGSTM